MANFKTKRFILRPLIMDDAARLVALCNDPDIARNTARIPAPYTLSSGREYIRNITKGREAETEYAFAVCADEDIIACVGATREGETEFEIGYWVGADYRGAGVASEIAEAIIRFAKEELGAKIITAGHFADNPASGSVLEKVGFVRTGEMTALFSVGRGEAARCVRMVLKRN